jgi:hypothetical protein
MSGTTTGSEGLMAKLSTLSALYVVYLFISGWTFFDYYYREFGIDPRWLDLPLTEVLMKGFTILFTGGWWLWPIYLVMIAGTLVVDEIAMIHKRVLGRFAVAAILFAALIGVYFASRSAGSAQAKIDEGPRSRLSLITLSRKPETKADGGAVKVEAPKVDYTGKVLAFRAGVYYLHNVSTLVDQSSQSIALCVFRIEDLTDIKVVEH